MPFDKEHLGPEEEVTMVVAFALRDANLKVSDVHLVRGLLRSAAGTYFVNTRHEGVEIRKSVFMQLAEKALEEIEETAAAGELQTVTGKPEESAN